MKRNAREVLQAIEQSWGKRNMGPTTRELFDATGLFPGTIVGVVHTLERHGYLERPTEGNGTFRFLKLTEKARKALGIKPRVDNADDLLRSMVLAWDSSKDTDQARFIELMDLARTRLGVKKATSGKRAP